MDVLGPSWRYLKIQSGEVEREKNTIRPVHSEDETSSTSSSSLNDLPSTSFPRKSKNMVKEKPNSTRIYDEEGFRRRAACICVKNEDENEVLLVTSSRRPEHWIFPGGGVEPEEEASVTAIREVLEEAGVLGKLGRSLGVFENMERKHRTEVFVMVVSEELPEWEDSQAIDRKRKWFTIEEALHQLAQHKPAQLTYLQSMLSCRNDKVT